MACLKKMCRECPFSRNSVPGYLGEASHDPEGFIGSHWFGDIHLPCHMAVDWNKKEDNRNYDNAPTCHGFATLCKNSAKLPLNRQDAEIVKSVEADRINVFSNIYEFIKHHKKEWKNVERM